MPDNLLAQAEEALDAGKAKEALALAEKVPSDAPDAIDAKALAVECLAELGRWLEAGARAAAVLREDPAWPTGHLIAGLAAIETGRIAEATPHLLEALKLDESLTEAAEGLAVTSDFEGRYHDADRWMGVARQSDAGEPVPFHVDAQALDDLLLEAVEDMPEHAIETLDESRFRVLPMPTAADLKAGTPLTATYRIEELDPEGDPPSMALVLYQRNLEREAGDRKGLEDAVADAIIEALEVLAAAAAKIDGAPASAKKPVAKAKPAPKPAAKPAKGKAAKKAPAKKKRK